MYVGRYNKQICKKAGSEMRVCVLIKTVKKRFSFLR